MIYMKICFKSKQIPCICYNFVFVCFGTKTNFSVYIKTQYGFHIQSIISAKSLNEIEIVAENIYFFIYPVKKT